jgi:hypothetical protein
MKFELEIPNWVNPNLTLMLLAGQELVAFKQPNRSLKVKRERCNRCGECCLDTPNKHTPFGSDDEDKCNALKRSGDQWICTAGARKPYRCLPDPNQEIYPGCSIRYI